ncbi:MAG TPA: hypothetical protein VGN63_08630 [Flavisolibacter sp.]|nr:hypothetical protein [Flavisolibacter sp.]
MIKQLLSYFILAFLLCSCWPNNRPERPPKKVWGYKPVYSTDTSVLQVVADTPRTVLNAGKIYAYKNLIYQNEVGEGIHVLDNSNPSQIRNIGFIRIKGNSEVSIKETFLYANSFADLVVVDISDWRQPKEVKRMKNVFAQGGSIQGAYRYIPLPEHNVYYDCMSFQPGIQTGWVRDSIWDNTCFYQ